MDCIFCKIANGEIPSATVYEDDQVRVILDLGPAAKGHALVLPKEHFRDSTEAPEALLGHVMAVGAAVGAAEMKAFGADGYNLIQNNGLSAGQTVFHFHLHVIPRRGDDGVLGLWKPGKSTPEGLAETAALLKPLLEA